MKKKMPIFTLKELFHQAKAYWPQFFLYQSLMRFAFAVLFVPGYLWLGRMLMRSAGYTFLTESTIARYLLTPQGMIYMFVGATGVVLAALLQIGGLIRLSAEMKTDENPRSIRQIVLQLLKQAPKFLHVGGLILLIQMVFLAPILGFGVRLNFLQNLKAPDFIMEFIQSQLVASLLYTGFLLLAYYFCYRLLFSFCCLLLRGKNANEAIRDSWRLTKKGGARLFYSRIRFHLLMMAGAFFIFAIWQVFLMFCFWVFGERDGWSWLFAILYILQTIGEFLGVFVLSILEILHTVGWFSILEEGEQMRPIPFRSSSLYGWLHLHRVWLSAAAVIAIACIAVPVRLSLQVGHTPNLLGVVAHRASTNGFPENTIEGLEESIRMQIPMVEIDVQRTKDGVYVLNHDANFSRVAGVNQKVSDMSWDDIQKMQLHSDVHSDKPVRVPRMEEVLDCAKGRIFLNIELKGDTADQKMAEDLTVMIRERGMQNEVLYSSLNLPLIAWCNKEITDIDCGAIFFINYGDPSQIDADWLISEAMITTPRFIDQAHEAGKYVMVWTINTTSWMEHFLYSRVDAVITDHPTQMLSFLPNTPTFDQRNYLYYFFTR